jgi:4-cresol dehydrogenase (hydroxylating)
MGLSAAQFERALKSFARVVGEQWVLASDEDRGTYSDFYAPGSEEVHAPAAGVAPASAEEVQAIIRLANEYKVPLWPVSRGKNLGYGAAAPRLPGSVVLDLGRMNRILEVDEKLAYCVIEPGVSFFDLQNYIEEHKLPLWLSVPGNAWGSVMGNALDRGFGYTPYGLHTNNICGMEVVMPDGDMIRTGMGAMAGNPTWHLNRYGFGPSWDQMFCQSNLGVVTKMGMWLMPEPESSLLLTVEGTEEEDIGWLVDTIAPLRIRGVIQQNVFMPSWLGKLTLISQRSQWYDKPNAMPEERVQEILKQNGMGYWNVFIRLYGDARVNEVNADIIKKAFRQHTDKEIKVIPWNKGDPRSVYDPSLGVPTALPLQMGNWVGGRGAHLAFSPILPPSRDHVLRQLKRSRDRFREFDFDFYGSFTVNDRFAVNINMLMYNRDDEQQVKRIRTLFDALIADARQAGYGEYRTHLDWMDRVAASYDFNNNALLRLNEKVKDALDPNGILAPGKQGVWPSVYKGHRS